MLMHAAWIGAVTVRERFLAARYYRRRIHITSDATALSNRQVVSGK